MTAAAPAHKWWNDEEEDLAGQLNLAQFVALGKFLGTPMTPAKPMEPFMVTKRSDPPGPPEIES